MRKKILMIGNTDGLPGVLVDIDDYYTFFNDSIRIVGRIIYYHTLAWKFLGTSTISTPSPDWTMVYKPFS